MFAPSAVIPDDAAWYNSLAGSEKCFAFQRCVFSWARHSSTTTQDNTRARKQGTKRRNAGKCTALLIEQGFKFTVNPPYSKRKTSADGL
jgi:hypothetical protein